MEKHLELALLFRSWEEDPPSIFTSVKMEILFLEIINSSLSGAEKARLTALMIQAGYASPLEGYVENFLSFIEEVVPSVGVFVFQKSLIGVVFPSLDTPSGRDYLDLKYDTFFRGREYENSLHK